MHNTFCPSYINQVNTFRENVQHRLTCNQSDCNWHGSITIVVATFSRVQNFHSVCLKMTCNEWRNNTTRLLKRNIYMENSNLVFQFLSKQRTNLALRYFSHQSDSWATVWLIRAKYMQKQYKLMTFIRRSNVLKIRRVVLFMFKNKFKKTRQNTKLPTNN